jgi:hypothetical protein
VLISKPQGGFNDNWVYEGGTPRNVEIGDDFLVASHGSLDVVQSRRQLNGFYDRHGLENWHKEYLYAPSKSEDTSEK